MMTEEMRHRFGADFYESGSIRDFVSSGSGGVADYIIVAKTSEAIVDAVVFAGKYNLSWKVIGRGTHLLVSDIGYAGLLIIDQTSQILPCDHHSQLLVASGVIQSMLATYAVENSLSGLEAWVHNQGTIGGALYHNLLTGDTAIVDMVKSVNVATVQPDGSVGIATHSGRWLVNANGSPRLPRKQQSCAILSVKLQLKLARLDIIFTRTNQLVKLIKPVKSPYLTEIFVIPDDHRSEILPIIGQACQRVAKKSLWQKNPFSQFTWYTQNGGTLVLPKPTSVKTVFEFLEMVRDDVASAIGFDLEIRLELLGEIEGGRGNEAVAIE